MLIQALLTPRSGARAPVAPKHCATLVASDGPRRRRRRAPPVQQEEVVLAMAWAGMCRYWTTANHDGIGHSDFVAGSIITSCLNRFSHVLWATPWPKWPGSCADIHIVVVPYRRFWEPATSLAKLTTTDRSSRKAFSFFFWACGNPKIGARNHEPRTPPVGKMHRFLWAYRPTNVAVAQRWWCL